MNIELYGIKKEYNGRNVLDIDYLKLESGKIHAVLGPNGSGKTTLLRLISCMEAPTDGKLLYDGNAQFPAHDINYLLQKPYLFNMDVIDNVLLGCDDKNRMLAMEALNKLGMKYFANYRSGALSGGEAQKVAIARTLISGKRMILLDEPLSAVDISSTEKVDDYIRSINREHSSTIIIATHSPSEALKIADHAVILWNGRIIENGTPEEVLLNPVTDYGKEFMKNWRI